MPTNFFYYFFFRKKKQNYIFDEIYKSTKKKLRVKKKKEKKMLHYTSNTNTRITQHRHTKKNSIEFYLPLSLSIVDVSIYISN